MTAPSAQSTPLGPNMPYARVGTGQRSLRFANRASQSRYTLRHLHPSNMSALGLLAPLAVAGGVNTLPEPSGSQTVEMGTVFVPFLELVSHLKYAAFTHHISAHSPGDSHRKKNRSLTYVCAHSLSLFSVEEFVMLVFTMWPVMLGIMATLRVVTGVTKTDMLDAGDEEGEEEGGASMSGLSKSMHTDIEKSTKDVHSKAAAAHSSQAQPSSAKPSHTPLSYTPLALASLSHSQATSRRSRRRSTTCSAATTRASPTCTRTWRASFGNCPSCGPTWRGGRRWRS